MHYGGRDISEFMLWLMKNSDRHHFPYPQCSLSNPLDMMLLHDIKRECCHLDKVGFLFSFLTAFTLLWFDFLTWCFYSGQPGYTDFFILWAKLWKSHSSTSYEFVWCSFLRPDGTSKDNIIYWKGVYSNHCFSAGIVLPSSVWQSGRIFH